MKKGFTLIELLAAIIVLTIIMLIATPRIMDAIENSKIKAYKQDEQMMVKATETYFGNNVDLLPENIGDTVEVKLSDLKTNEFISEVSDCNGYILVTKTEEGYSYNPELKCGESNTIATSADDGLIAYYPFDDFQEPTENIWITKLGQNSNVHVNDDSEETFIQPFYPLPYDVTYEKMPLTLTFDFDYISYDGCAGRILYWEFQKYLDTTYAGGVTTLNLYPADDNLHKIKQLSIPVEDGSWSNLKLKYSTAIDNDHIHYSDHMVDVWMNKIQIEEKGYATPYTEGIREGVIKDYSINSNNILLDIETTPRWLEEKGNGFYEFDGIDKYIGVPDSPEFDLLSTSTISLWARTDLEYPSPDTNTKYRGLVSKAINGGTAGISYFVDWKGTNNKRYLRMGISNGITYQALEIGDFDFENKWQNIVITRTLTDLKMYVNGELKKGATNNIGQIQDLATNLDIGRAFSLGTYSFDGDIDDVKIYNRALTAEEIKYQYDTKKEIYN